MSVDKAYEYARLCCTEFLEEKPPHESELYEPWDYILKALFPLEEGYAMIGQLALIKRTAIHAQGPTPDFVVCTRRRFGYRRVSFMAVEIKNFDENREAAAKQLFEYMELLANAFSIQGQKAVYGLLCVGPDWSIYKLDIAGGAKPRVVVKWTADFASEASLERFQSLKELIVPMVEEAEKLSKKHGVDRSSQDTSPSASPPPPPSSPAQSLDPKDVNNSEVPEPLLSSRRSIDDSLRVSEPEEDFFSEELFQQSSPLPRFGTEPSVQSVAPKDIFRGHNPPSTRPPFHSRSSRTDPPVQSTKPKGGPRGNNPSSKQSSTTTSHQSMTKSVEPKGAPQGGNPSSFSRSSIATPHGGKANDADVRDSPDPLDLFRPGNRNRGRSQRPMGNALVSRGQSARRPQADCDDGSSPDELDLFRSDDRRRRLEKEMTDPMSSSGPSGSTPHIPEVRSDPMNVGPSAPKHPVSKVESNSNVRHGDGSSSLNPKHPRK